MNIISKNQKTQILHQKIQIEHQKEIIEMLREIKKQVDQRSSGEPRGQVESLVGLTLR